MGIYGATGHRGETNGRGSRSGDSSLVVVGVVDPGTGATLPACHQQAHRRVSITSKNELHRMSATLVHRRNSRCAVSVCSLHHRQVTATAPLRSVEMRSCWGFAGMRTPLPGEGLPQRLHVAVQKPPATMKSAPHLPQTACWAQVKPPEGTTSAQAACRPRCKRAGKCMECRSGLHDMPQTPIRSLARLFAEKLREGWWMRSKFWRACSGTVA